VYHGRGRTRARATWLGLSLREFARNLNTANSDSGTEIKVAHTTILHSRQYPSAIVLPVVSAGKTVTLVP
jgi:predicted acyl esterase